MKGNQTYLTSFRNINTT